MNPLLKMNGRARSVMCIVGDEHTWEVVRYADGSLGTLRDGETLGVWKARDLDGCLRAFIDGIPGGLDAVDLIIQLGKTETRLLRLNSG